MATIKLCDWFKTKINEDNTFVVIVGEKEFEVGEEGLHALVSQLEGEDVPEATRTVEVDKIVYRDAPPPTLDSAQPGIGVEISSDPFESSPGSMPQPVRADVATPQLPDEPKAELTDEERLRIPEDITKRLKTPTREQAAEVMREATKFEEGSLPSLTVGGSAQREASRRLKAVESQHAQALKRRGKGQGFNVGDDTSNKPGYYEE